MSDLRKKKIEFGDFQTPDGLASAICKKLYAIGIRPEAIIEPTCGVGAFVLAAANSFPSAKKIIGLEVNHAYLDVLSTNIRRTFNPLPNPTRIELEQCDFYTVEWQKKFAQYESPLLILGNLPWVTNSVQGAIGGANLPKKSNFLNQGGFDAISGKSNFDISEWMLLELLRCFRGSFGDIAILVKTAVARKVLAHAERQKMFIRDARVYAIDAKKEFNAAVDACLLVIRLHDGSELSTYDYTVFKHLSEDLGQRVGHRNGFTVRDTEAFASCSFLLGAAPQKWRSGVKHDASAVMEFTRTAEGLINGLGEQVDVEQCYLYPLLKGSDIGSAKQWRKKYVLVTQQFVGQRTDLIRLNSPKTWKYLELHSETLDSRGSTIYKNNPRFSVFGVGDYSFRPWRIAICGLYKSLTFRLVGPIEGKPVMFDDTVYFISFDSQLDAQECIDLLRSTPAIKLFTSLIFWDEKRPIKTGILNTVDWSRLEVNKKAVPAQLEMDLSIL